MAVGSAKARKRRHYRMRRNLSGTADRPRLSVFRSVGHIYAQVIDDEAGVTLASASTIDKALSGDVGDKSKVDQAKAVGTAIAERAKAAGVSAVVFDRGGFRYHGRVQALAEAAREGGLKF